MKNNIYKATFMLAIFLCGILVANLIPIGKAMSIQSSVVKVFNFKKTPMTEQDIIDDCIGLDSKDTAYCIRDNVKTFFDYSIINEKYYDLETLKEKGGDCYNYAMFYDKIFRELNFNSKTIHIDNGEIDHRITIISSEEGYCVVDLLNVVCWVEK